MYSLGTIYLGHRRIKFSYHALKRALDRKIDSDMVRATILGGRQIKRRKVIIFLMPYKTGKVVCIGERTNGDIIIKTIMWKK